MRLSRLFDDPVLRDAVATAAADAAERIARLTPRQRQILLMITDGHLNKVTAHELGVSPRTVKNHRRELMTRTLSQLVRLTVLAGE